MRILALMLCTCLAAPAAMAQQTAAPPRPANPAQAPANPTPSNPAAAPVYPAPDARASEAGMAPLQPAPGVTQRVEEAGNHDIDAQGHTLDPHGKPVGAGARAHIVAVTSPIRGRTTPRDWATID